MMSGTFPPLSLLSTHFHPDSATPLQSILGIKLSTRQTELFLPYLLDLYCASSCFIFIFALL